VAEHPNRVRAVALDVIDPEAARAAVGAAMFAEGAESFPLPLASVKAPADDVVRVAHAPATR
jgi:hypothetical protein